MRPQFFPWLFDDRNAWEKSLSDPRWSYELPMENFMALYQTERRVDGNAQEMALPMFAPMMPIASAPISTAPAFSAMPIAAAPVQHAAPAAPPHHEAKSDGILSQDEIDALLSGL